MAVMGVLRLPTVTATSGALGSGTLNSTLHSLVLVQRENAKDRSHLPGHCPAPAHQACPPGEGIWTAIRSKQPAQGTLGASLTHPLVLHESVL